MIIGVMEHIEEAGIHSGVPPARCRPMSLPKEIVAELSARQGTRQGAVACAA